MAKLSQSEWERLRAEYETSDVSVRQLARDFGCGEKAIRDHAKKGGWVKSSQTQLLEENINVNRKLHEIKKIKTQIASKTSEVIDEKTKKALELEGIYADFEKSLISVAQKELQEHVVEGSVDNVVKLTTAAKNIKPTQSASQSVTIQNNTQVNNTFIDMTDEELERELIDTGARAL